MVVSKHCAHRCLMSPRCLHSHVCRTNIRCACSRLTTAVYAHHQERATKISHGATARHAKEYGDPMLATLCGSVASDEGRHEIAYQRIVEKFFEL